MKIGTLTTGVGVVTTINLNYLPQYIYYNAATQLTSVRIIVEGDGTILDLDADGLDAVAAIGKQGQISNGYLIALADGFVPNKVVTLEFTNSAAQTPSVYGFSMKKASVYVISQRYTVLANSEQLYDNFLALGISSPTTSDILTVEFRDGQVQRFESTELLPMLTLIDNIVTEYLFDNSMQNYRSVNIQPSTDRTVYLVAFRIIGNVSN